MTPMECLRKSRTPSTEFCLQENSANISPCLKKKQKKNFMLILMWSSLYVYDVKVYGTDYLY